MSCNFLSKHTTLLRWGSPRKLAYNPKYNVVHICRNSPATWTSRVPVLQATNPSSHFPSDEARSLIHIHTHTHTHVRACMLAHMHMQRHRHSQCHHTFGGPVFLTWPLSTASLLMSERTGSYTLGRIPHQTVHPFGHTPLCSSLSP